MRLVLFGLIALYCQNAIAVETGPTNIFDTGTMWVCLENIAYTKDCDEAEDGKICEQFEKIIKITPKVRIVGSKPSRSIATESCARLY